MCFVLFRSLYFVNTCIKFFAWFSQNEQSQFIESTVWTVAEGVAFTHVILYLIFCNFFVLFKFVFVYVLKFDYANARNETERQKGRNLKCLLLLCSCLKLKEFHIFLH